MKSVSSLLFGVCLFYSLNEGVYGWGGWFGPKGIHWGYSKIGHIGPLGYSGIGGIKMGKIGGIHYGSIGGMYGSLLGAANPSAREAQPDDDGLSNSVDANLGEPQYDVSNNYAGDQQGPAGSYTQANYAPTNYAVDNYAPVNSAPDNYAPVNSVPANYAPVNSAPDNYATVNSVPANYAPVPNYAPTQLQQAPNGYEYNGQPNYGYEQPPQYEQSYPPPSPQYLPSLQDYSQY